MIKRASRYSASVLITLVFISNVQAGLVFVLKPQDYMLAFELNGLPGEIAVAGTGLLFLMWNVPYLFALLNPVKYRISLLQAVLMQAIGLGGETLLLKQISAEIYPALHSSILRFIVFDGAGLLFLLAALFLVRSSFRKNGKAV